MWVVWARMGGKVGGKRGEERGFKCGNAGSCINAGCCNQRIRLLCLALFFSTPVADLERVSKKAQGCCICGPAASRRRRRAAGGNGPAPPRINIHPSFSQRAPIFDWLDSIREHGSLSCTRCRRWNSFDLRTQGTTDWASRARPDRAAGHPVCQRSAFALPPRYGMAWHSCVLVAL